MKPYIIPRPTSPYGLGGGNLRILAERIAEAAARGVTVIVESHSLNLFNGIRIAIIKEYVDWNDVLFLYCKNVERHLKVQALPIDRHGRLPLWPTGFFDQVDLDLGEILDGGKCK